METIAISLAVLVFSAVLHEIAHGYVADRLGDPTARIAGRLTLNPLPHIDPLMSVAVPLILMVLGSPLIFGAAKPVPVNPLMLKEGRKDLALVALSGPMTNFIIAIIAALLINLFGSSPFLQIIVFYNLALGFLNLLPIPPLDGSKFFSIVLPETTAQKYYALAPFGFLLLYLFLIYTPLGEWLFSLIQNAANLLGIAYS